MEIKNIGSKDVKDDIDRKDSSLLRNIIAVSALVASSAASACGGRTDLAPLEQYIEVEEDAGMDSESDVKADVDYGEDVQQDVYPDEDAMGCNFVKVSLSEKTPEGATVPVGAQNVPMVCWTMENMCEGNDLKIVNVNLKGVGDMKSIDTVQAYLDDGVDNHVVSGHSQFQYIGNQRVAELSMSNFVLPSNATQDLCVMADISQDAITGQYALSLESADDLVFVSEPEVLGDFPIEGNWFNITSSYKLNEAKIENAGEFQAFWNTCEYDSELAVATIKVDGDSFLSEVAFSIAGGNCEVSNLHDFNLFVDTQVVAQAAAVSPDGKVYFKLDEQLYLQKGEQHLVGMTADAVDWCDGVSDIKTYLVEPDDLVLIDVVTGYQLPVDNETYNGVGEGATKREIEKMYGVYHYDADVEAYTGQIGVNCFNFNVDNQLNNGVVFTDPHMYVLIDTASEAGGLIDTSVNPSRANIRDLRAVVDNQDVMMDQLDVLGDDYGQTTALALFWHNNSCDVNYDTPRDVTIYFDIADNPVLKGSNISCHMYWPDGETGSLTYEDGQAVPHDLIKPSNAQGGSGLWLGMMPIEIK